MNSDELLTAWNALMNDDASVVESILERYPGHAHMWNDLSTKEQGETYPNGTFTNHFYSTGEVWYGMILDKQADGFTCDSHRVCYGVNTDPVDIATIADVVMCMTRSTVQRDPCNVRALLGSYERPNVTLRVAKFGDDRVAFYVTGQGSLNERCFVFDNEALEYVRQGSTVIAQSFASLFEGEYHPYVITESNDVLFLTVGEKNLSISGRYYNEFVSIVSDNTPLFEFLRAASPN